MAESHPEDVRRDYSDDEDRHLSALVDKVIERRQEFNKSVKALKSHFVSSTLTVRGKSNDGMQLNEEEDLEAIKEKQTIDALAALVQRLRRRSDAGMRFMDRGLCVHSGSQSSGTHSRTDSEAAFLPQPVSASNSLNEDKMRRKFHYFVYYVEQNRAFKHATQTATAVLLASLLNLSGAFKGVLDGNTWAVLTVLVVSEATHGALIRKGVQRMIGTTIGGVYGLVMLSVLFAMPPDCLQCGWKPFAVGAMIFASTFIISYFKLRNAQQAYAYTICALTVILVLLGEWDDAAHGSENWTPGIPFYLRPFYDSSLLRISLIIVGVLISFLVSSVVFPQKASARIPEQIGDVLMKIAGLQESIHEAYTSDDFVIDEFRRSALKQSEQVSGDLEKLRGSVNTSKDELFLTKRERWFRSVGPSRLQGAEKMFYLTVTMVYGRIWGLNDNGLHRVLDADMHFLFESFDVLLRSTARIYQRKTLDPDVRIADADLLRRSVLPLIHDAVYMVIYLFKVKQKRLHESSLFVAYSEKDWTNWNHFSFSFVQCLVNLGDITDWQPTSQ